VNVSLPAQIFHSAPGDLRGAERSPVNVGGTVRGGTGAPLDVNLHDLSTTGFAMECGEELRPGQTIWIGITGAGVNAACVVRRTSDGWACQFLQPISEKEHQSALASLSTVISTPWSDPPTPAAIEPEVARWPFLARAAFIIGSSLALWAAIYWIFG
jgi:hypothetical protein